jgi:hypothetical protein
MTAGVLVGLQGSNVHIPSSRKENHREVKTEKHCAKKRTQRVSKLEHCVPALQCKSTNLESEERAAGTDIH